MKYQAPVPVMVFGSNSKFIKIWSDLVENTLNRSQRNFAHVMTVTLSWRVQNFILIGQVHFKPEHWRFWSSFEFDRNIASGTGARTVMLGPAVGSRCHMLTHWGRDKMASISQTTLSNAFSWMEMLKFRFKFHWLNLFLRVQLIIFQHWFR